MAKKDPHDEEPPHTYECTECQFRVNAEDHPGECPECGGRLQNIGRSREK